MTSGENQPIRPILSTIRRTCPKCGGEMVVELLRPVDSSSDSGEDVHDLTAWYQRRDTVLLDDIGMEAATAWVREQLTALVEERLHSGGWMVLATNLNKAAMADRMGDRLASRLYAGNPELPEVAVVINTAEDYRA